jgi:hydroxymethylpyrimidine/phosphomethylpyrimidine kinase
VSLCPPPPPRILSIAGSDSSGGAGIQADIKTITMLGGYAMTAITAVTAQDTTGVHAAEALSPAIVAAQIDACIGDIGVDAIKIGMLGSAEIAAIVADRLEGLSVPIVFDPVMIATSGSALADAGTIAGFERLMRIATLTTPNVAELAALGGDAAMAARSLAYLAKGGDAEGELVEDRLVVPGLPPTVWQAARIVTRHNHGTGCTLASAIATLLGRGLALDDAVAEARLFVRAALEAAPGFGQGHGPLGHQAVPLSKLR